MADIGIMNELEKQLAEQADKIGSAGSYPNTGNRPVEGERFGMQNLSAPTATFDVKKLSHRMSDENDAFVCGVVIENPAVESAKVVAEVTVNNRHDADIYDFWLSTIANKYKVRIDYEAGFDVVRFFVKPVMPWEVTSFEYSTPYEMYAKAFTALASVFTNREIPEIEKLL